MLSMGTATGLGTYDCPKHGAWREKNPAAVALGRSGGLATQAKLTEKERIARATKIADKRWMDEKLKKNAVKT